MIWLFIFMVVVAVGFIVYLFLPIHEYGWVVTPNSVDRATIEMIGLYAYVSVWDDFAPDVLARMGKIRIVPAIGALWTKSLGPNQYFFRQW